MKRLFFWALCALAVVAIGQCAYAQTCPPGNNDNPWVFQIASGSAYSFNSSLRITQDGFPPLDFTARYNTKPFSDGTYYDLRLGKWTGNKGWEIEWLHHKIYLDNNPPEVQDFNISHGFNILMYNSVRKSSKLIYRFGGGPVITHPESVVRGQDFGGNYYLSGVGAQYAIEKRYKLTGNLFGSLEAKFTAAYAQVKVANGHANVPNYAIHGLFGIGYAF